MGAGTKVTGTRFREGGKYLRTDRNRKRSSEEPEVGVAWMGYKRKWSLNGEGGGEAAATGSGVHGGARREFSNRKRSKSSGGGTGGWGSGRTKPEVESLQARETGSRLHEENLGGEEGVLRGGEVERK